MNEPRAGSLPAALAFDGRPAASWLRRHSRALVLAGLTLVAYLAALNRVQPMLWAVAALFLATLLAGIAWPHWLVRRLSVQRSGPPRAGEGETLQLTVRVRNRGRLPRFMVELVDRLPFVGAASGEAAAEVVLGQVAWVPGGGERHFTVSLLAEKRGLYRLGPVGLASSFPLGLAEARQGRNEGLTALTIYPEVFPIVALPLRGTPTLIHRGALQLPDGAGSSEFCGLREYRRGDSPRHIHWPSSARNNELMVREFEPLASASLCLVLDCHAGANLGRGRQASFEVAVRIAASMARHACDNGLPVRLLGQGGVSLHIPPGCGDLHFQAILDALAVVAADGVAPYAAVLEGAARELMPGETVVSFHSEPALPGRAPDSLGARALLRQRGAHLLAVRFNPESFTGATAWGSDALAAGLLELGAQVVPVRQGDDLTALFNP
ncbi:MAG TPA: DUF58 domain-containing protein [Azospira sp.]|nr:DUF58 domain-containing protein [Azospira sp.]